MDSCIPFGWQNFWFYIPEDWCIGEVSGDVEKGYIRIDDIYNVRIEIKWETKRTCNPLSAVVDNIINKILKESKDNGAETRRNIGLLRRNWFNDKEFEVFSIGESLNLLYRCSTCQRLVLIRCYLPEENRVKTFQKIFEDFQDHPVAKQGGVLFSRWAQFYLNFKVPAQYRLIRTKMQAGVISLAFDNKGSLLEIGKLCLADIWLKMEPLDNWIKNFFEKELRPYKYSIDNGDVFNHRGVSLTGQRHALQLRTPKYASACGWHSERLNSVFFGFEKARKEPYLLNNLKTIFEELIGG